ncbi:PREDICTED: uncharacterized protein LOC109171518 [Ipomoea nil]|uniref:uncharacterized protein LOC109171518 n=1 Tax=Ipomoea nil TaxID=35883 RepID=UPI0009016EC1|nr:PREDICTED: uncharacterized protein LOC109171518 [Ipomoea nil]
MAARVILNDNTKTDIVGWGPTEDKVFSIKSAYDLMIPDNKGLDKEDWGGISKLRTPNRIRSFIWLGNKAGTRITKGAQDSQSVHGGFGNAGTMLCSTGLRRQLTKRWNGSNDSSKKLKQQWIKAKETKTAMERSSGLRGRKSRDNRREQPWKPSDIGWIKINTDGCAGNGNLATCGGVFRDENATFLGALEAELWDMYMGMEKA